MAPSRSLSCPRPSLVILAPHPDDDVLGCGLRIAAAIASGFRVSVVFLTDGQASHPGSRTWPPARLGRLRRGEARRALARLGAGRATIRFMGWPDGALDGGRHVSRARALRLRRLLRAVAPGGATVLVSAPTDHHPDHQAAFALARRVVPRGDLETYRVWSRVDRPGSRPARHPAKGRKGWAAQAYRSQLGGIADAPDGFAFDPAALAQLTGDAEVFERPRRARHR